VNGEGGVEVSASCRSERQRAACSCHGIGRRQHESRYCHDRRRRERFCDPMRCSSRGLIKRRAREKAAKQVGGTGAVLKGVGLTSGPRRLRQFERLPGLNLRGLNSAAPRHLRRPRAPTRRSGRTWLGSCAVQRRRNAPANSASTEGNVANLAGTRRWLPGCARRH